MVFNFLLRILRYSQVPRVLHKLRGGKKGVNGSVKEAV